MKKKIALGFGNNIDYEIVWDSGVIENLIREYGISDRELSADIAINSERDLLVSILGFIKTGCGGERFVSSCDIIETFAARFSYRITLGGTSVRAAAAMRKLGHSSVIHLVTINDHVRERIPDDCTYICSAEEENLFPHLIVQYGNGTRITAADIDICTDRGDRMIYVNDSDNSEMKLHEDFAGLVTEAKVLLISGFNAMRDPSLLEKRLKTLVKIISALPRDALVFYEDACFHQAEMRKQLRDALADKINIFSMNEDELQGHLERKLDLLDPNQVADALADIHMLIPSPLIVVHTRHWALAYGENAVSFEEALKGGIKMATARIRFGDNFTAENYHETKKCLPKSQGVRFADEMNRLLHKQACCLPSLDAGGFQTATVGLGDAFVGGFLAALADADSEVRESSKGDVI